jgi:hypothetical protein
MPNWLRILLALFAAGLLVLVLAGVLAYRWMKKNGPQVAEKAKVASAEGRKFGEGKTAPECVEEGLRHAKEAKGFMEGINTQLFSSSCLTAATTPEGFCEVPEGLMDRARWSAEQCTKRGMPGNQGCIAVFNSVMAHCTAGPRRGGQ